MEKLMNNGVQSNQDLGDNWAKDNIGDILRGGMVYSRDRDFNDFELLRGYSEHKVYSLRILYDTIISGLEIVYELPNKKQIKSGPHCIKYSKSEQITMGNGEYITCIYGSGGEPITWLSVVTSEGRTITVNKVNDGQGYTFKLEAPYGYHLSSIGGSYGPEFNCLGYIEASVYSIREKPSGKLLQLNREKQQCMMREWPIKQIYLRLIERLLLPYLDLSDTVRVFKTCKELSLLRYQPYVLRLIGIRCIYSMDIYKRRYFGTLLKNPLNSSNQKNKFIKLLWDCTKNIVISPYGNHGYEGWTKTENEEQNRIIKYSTHLPNYTCFACTYQQQSMQFQENIELRYGPVMIQKLIKREIGLVFGGYFSAFRGLKGYVYLQVIVIGKNGVQLLNQKIEKQAEQIQPLSNGKWQEIFVQYIYTEDINSDNSNTPQIVVLKFGGKDGMFWAGYYGPRMTGFYVRAIPLTNNNDNNTIDFQYKDYDPDSIEQKLFEPPKKPIHTNEVINYVITQ